MSKKKLYFLTFDGDGDECLCYPESHFQDFMREEGIDEITVVEAIPDKVDGYFFCGWIDEVSETGDCGKACKGYEPRNGKSGICKNKRPLYTGGEDRILRLKP